MYGYSLLELSIVVTIIALLMAGASNGSKLLDRAKLSTTIKQVMEIEAAIINFEERFHALPGDFPDAYRYFDDGSDNICGRASECNGDGDKKIELGTKYNSEIYRSWQHLELAKMIKGDFSGAWGVENYVLTSPLDTNYTLIYDNNLGNILKLGNEIAANGKTSDGGAFFPEDAEKIDLKIDDGAPYKGFIRAIHGYIDDGEEKDSYDTNCYKDKKYKVSHIYSKSCVMALLVQ